MVCVCDGCLCMCDDDVMVCVCQGIFVGGRGNISITQDFGTRRWYIYIWSIFVVVFVFQ